MRQRTSFPHSRGMKLRVLLASLSLSLLSSVAVADTIGAGDTFGAGLIDQLGDRHLDDLTSTEIAEILAYAARAAAVTVSRPGADPPYRAEVG